MKMTFTFNDGGRAAAGLKGQTGDCVVRAVAIATEQDYETVYNALSDGSRKQRLTKRSKIKSSARNGVNVKRQWFKDYMWSLGWQFTATMGIGTGCRVHLHDNELPMGRLIVSVSKHYTSVIDGVIHDLYDPRRDASSIRPDDGGALKPGEWRNSNGICLIQRRCVYGYWHKSGTPPASDSPA